MPCWFLLHLCSFIQPLSGAFVQFAHQLAAIHPDAAGAQLHHLSEVQAELQHHDAVTGTSKQHVVFGNCPYTPPAVA